MCGMTGNAQSFLWAKNMGGTGSDGDLGVAVAVDRNSNVFVAGSFSSATADFNLGGSPAATLTRTGNIDGVLAKYDAAGGYLWAKRMGGSSGSYAAAKGVATDGNGNVYITGVFGKSSGLGGVTVDFNPGGSGGMLTNTGYPDVFLAKYAPDGTFLWAKNMGGTGTDQGAGVATDGDNNVYITGYFNSPTASFPGTLTAINGTYDVFVAKYDSSGNYLWGRNQGGTSTDLAAGIAVDGNDNVYITGTFGATADFNTGGTLGQLKNIGGPDVFLAKYDRNGTYLWAKGMGGLDNDQGAGVATDGNNNVYVIGMFYGAGNFNPGGGGGALTAVDQDVFLVKYDSIGNYLWTKGVGGSSDDWAQGVAVDDYGNVFITGEFGSTTADFNPGGSGGTLTNGGSYDGFLAKYTAGGNYLWARNYAGNDDDECTGIAVDGSGSVYGAGYFYSATGDFNPGGNGGTLTNTGDYDLYIVKYACDTSSSHLTASTCAASYTLNDSVYTAAGTYTQHFLNMSGCDSTVTLDLTFYQLDPAITIADDTLGTVDTYATYQWIRNDTLIPGATNATYIVTANANYRVAVTSAAGCMDTSDAYPVTNVRVDATGDMTRYISIYPNPASDLVYISSPVAVHAVLTTMDGRNILRADNAESISVKQVPAGIYFLRVLDAEHRLLKVERMVINH